MRHLHPMMLKMGKPWGGNRPGAVAPYLLISASSVLESSALNATIGTLSVANLGAATVTSYTITVDTGSKFNISGDLLRGNGTFNYEAATSHSVTISAALSAGGPVVGTLIIGVTNVLEVTLAALTLSASTIAENSVAGTTVGTATGKTSGSTLTLTDDAGGRFAINGAGTGIMTGLTQTDYETATSHNITIRETHPDGINSPRDSTVAITVTNVAETTLAALTLSANSIAEGSAAATVVGAVVGQTAGSSLSITDTAGTRFALSGTNIVAGATPTDYESATTHNITIRETLAEGINSPRDSVIAITVTNVLDAATLAALTLSTPTVVEATVPAAVVSAIVGKTSGSSLSMTDTAGNRFAVSGTDVVTGSTATDYDTATSHNITLRETLADSSNSPRDTVLAIAVTVANIDAPTIAVPGDTEFNDTTPDVNITAPVDALDGDTLRRQFIDLDGPGGSEVGGWYDYQVIVIPDVDAVELVVEGVTELDDGYYKERCRFERGSAIGDWSAELERRVDLTAPLLSSTVPIDGATDVVITSNFTATFDEAIQFGATVSISLFKTDDTLVEEFDEGDIGTLISISGMVLTINPTSSLLGTTGYYIQITAGSIEDTASNAFAGITDETSWSFTSASADAVNPLISSSSPGDNDTGVAITVSPTITFDETVVFGTGLITLRENNGGWADLETFDVTTEVGTGNGQVSISGAILTINPTASLTNNREYAIRIASTAIDDAVGNSFAGIANDTTLSFTTVAANAAYVNAGHNGIETTAALSVTMPASLVAGNTLLLFHSSFSVAINAIDLTGNGFTQLDDDVITTRRVSVWAKQNITGSETSFTITASAACTHAVSVLQFSGGSSVAAACVPHSSNTQPDGPNLAPWSSAPTLWGTLFHQLRATIHVISAVPSGYTQIIPTPPATSLQIYNGTNDFGVGMATKVATAASDDPAAWTLAGTTIVSSFTFAITPG